MTYALPADWTPAVTMRRIIGHWTAGGNKANAMDKRAYHVLVEGDANVVRGNPSIALNVPKNGVLPNGYAAHTLNTNSDSIGVSMCGMAGAVESPFNAGSAPLTAAQFDRFCEVLAALCRRYSIPVGPKTVLFHAEVQSNLGIQQRAKWDVARLPFNTSVVGAKAIGDLMRSKVATLLARQEPTVDMRAPAEPVPDGAQARVTATRLAFRRGPGDTFEAMGDGLPRGTVVIVEEVKGAWLRVTTPAGYEGWVARSFVEVFDGPPVESPTKPDVVKQALADIRKSLADLEAALSSD